MIDALNSTIVYQVLQLLLLLLQAMISNATSSNPRCVVSSCGDIRNISYPFRLKSDPKECGDWEHELVCEENRTVMYLEDDRFYVQHIDYSTNKIRLVDDGLQKDNCSSLPSHSLLGHEYYYNRRNPYFMSNLDSLVIVNCSKPVSSPSYITTSPCIDGSYSSNTSSYWNLYALVHPKASDVRDFCTIHGWAWVSYDFGDEEQINSSSCNYKLIHNIMADGFDRNFYVFSGKNTFLCFFDFGSVYYGRTGCRSFPGNGKQRLAMKFYRNSA
ncbi:uncharacterized protein LOC115754284 [Rhodamnia argentea]|uniref:Uncharacterized protein LOC115754284 n=1 Tax=Rhodamnia argentea TaxID=178133 RepID=A0A8B8QQ19_9MYRT|nr:uncharacterized protein LOC115754284 [Rhodamnia argentea]